MKDQISSSYRKATQDKYLTECRSPSPRRRLVVMGCSEDQSQPNIGDAIWQEWDERMRPDPDSNPSTWSSSFSFSKSAVPAERTSDIGALDTVDTIVFNNGTTHLDWIEDQPEEMIGQVVHDTLYASMVGAQQFVKATLNKPYLKYIVFIGSMAYNHVLNGSAPYCAAKAGLAHYARCLTYELAPKGYLVFVVHPSNVADAPMSETTIQGLMRYRKLTRTEAEAYWSAEAPMGRFLTKEEVAKTVVDLVDGKHNHMNGAQIELGMGGR